MLIPSFINTAKEAFLARGFPEELKSGSPMHHIDGEIIILLGFCIAQHNRAKINQLCIVNAKQYHEALSKNKNIDDYDVQVLHTSENLDNVYAKLLSIGCTFNNPKSLTDASLDYIASHPQDIKNALPAMDHQNRPYFYSKVNQLLLDLDARQNSLIDEISNRKNVEVFVMGALETIDKNMKAMQQTIQNLERENRELKRELHDLKNNTNKANSEKDQEIKKRRENCANSAELRIKHSRSHHLFPKNYYAEIAAIFEKLPEKYAEKQAEVKQHELSLSLLSGTPYLPFYNVFMKLNEIYGPGGDYAKKYLGDPAFIRCRYPTIFTCRQKEFSGGLLLDICLQEKEHIPGNTPQGVYPAAKIQLREDNDYKFVVLGEGPYPHTFSTLLDRLAEQNVNVLVAVGPTEESGKEKYFNYMKAAKEISAEEYLNNVTDLKKIPDEFKNSENFTIKFYRYKRPENEKVFYIMHIPNWKDLGMPVFTDSDKHILAYDAEYGGNRFYHCSAGVGRSVAIVMMRMVYELICKENLNFEQAVQEFESILKRIKEVKPRAGEWWQLLLGIGLAEDMHEYMVQQLTAEVQQSQEVKRSLLLAGSIFNASPSLPTCKVDSSDAKDNTIIRMPMNT